MDLRLSTWKINSYLNCPEKYRLQHVEKVQRYSAAQQGFFDLGNIIHNNIEALYKGQITLEEAYESIWSWVLKMDSIAGEDKERTYIMLSGLLWKLYPSLPPKEYCKSEISYKIHMGHLKGIDVYLTLRIDLLIEMPGELPVIADFKTRTNHTDELITYDPQTSIYAYAIWRETGVIPVKRFYSLIKDFDNPEVIITQSLPSMQTIKNTEVTILRAINGILEKDFYLRPGFGCTFCNYRNDCFDLGGFSKL